MKNLIGSLSLALAFGAGVAHAESFALQKGDHISLIGNAMADRMQHSGYLESLIYAKYPDYNLVFRNLAVPGDSVGGFTDKPDKYSRQRSENFGSSDDWLTKEKTDVVFAFFGFNESFEGDAGLQKFKDNLDNFIKHTKAANYNGKGAPRLVLFSPMVKEKLTDPNLPDPTKDNANIKKYAAAMAEVAKANGVPLVDMIGISEGQFTQDAKRKHGLTFDTAHLTDEGDKLFAPEIFRAMFNETAPSGNFEKLRTAIVDKNEMWHSRYRTMDGYNVYGGRSAEAYQPGNPKYITDRNPPAPFVSNYQVMQEEMAQRDAMTAHRDQRVWAVAKGGDMKVDDSKLPEVQKVQSNKPGANEDGSYKFLSGEEAIKHMTVAKGCKVTLVASEEQFADLISPVQMDFDTKGRLWVAAWRNYPERTPTSKIGDKLLVFDLDANSGKATKVTTYLDDLNCPTGFQFYKDGVLMMQAPDLWFVRDTNGDGKADWKERILMGMDSADSHHTANSMVLEPGGATYLSDGVFHRTQVETALGPVRNTDGCVYRFEPSTYKFERYAAYGFANPHGRVFDYWGNDIITDATGNNNYFAPAFSGYLDFPDKHKKMQEFWKRPSRPCPGTGIISSRAFPEEFQNNFLNCNVIGFQGIFRVKVTEDGSGLKGETIEDLVKSDDPNFRPSAVKCAPDGSIYFLDWHKPLIGHLQHHLRDPNRDHDHGRIYRITYEGRPVIKPVKIDGQPIEKLLEVLKEPENDVRTRAKIELGKHDSAKVMAALDKWVAKLDTKDKDYEHWMTEALWVHQWHNVVDEALLKRMLRSPDYHARAAATRVLCYWRDRVSDPLALLKVQVNDESPRVRLEAIRACSFFRDTKALDVALEALNKPMDNYLQYCLDETTRQLERVGKQQAKN